MEIKTLFTEEEIILKAKELAKKIDADYNGEEIILTPILKGAAYFALELSKHITSPVKIDFIKVSSYEGTNSTGKINLTLDMSEDIENKNVLIVEDIVDTGRTLTYLKEYLRKRNPKSIKICTMLDKKERREFELEADYVGYEIPNKFVIGYGLDYDEEYRNLPYIGYIEQ